MDSKSSKALAGELPAATAAKNPVARKIIHCDCDCFYAAVEMRDDPSLVGKPIAVGGTATGRGVLTTCNYEAREFGCHSAMPTAKALRLCPELIVLPVAMQKYRDVSRDVREIFERYTDVIEPLSLDEAFLDVSGEESATRIARAIREDVRQLGITISAGVAPNKFLAKIASDWEKPDGLTVIRPQQIEAFVKALPVKKIFGVGKVTGEKLRRLGVDTCGDLQEFSLLELSERFGQFGERLYQLCRGIDKRAVQSSRIRKSLSVEHTLSENLEGLDACLAYLPGLFEELQRRLQKIDAAYQPHKLFIKLKFADFSQTSAEMVVAVPRFDDAAELLAKAVLRSEKSVRLMGVGVRFRAPTEQQLDLF